MLYLRLSAGRGYLVMDINGDNTIDNGSEIFSTPTVNGVKQLSMSAGRGPAEFIMPNVDPWEPFNR